MVFNRRCYDPRDVVRLLGLYTVRRPILVVGCNCRRGSRKSR